MTKRLLPLLLVLCLMLCACGKEVTPAETTPPTVAATEAPTDPAEVLEPETVETAPQILRHPLNGTILEKPWNNRVGAVVINNLKDHMVQT